MACQALYCFSLDGEALVGAKQNRIVNATILVQGNFGMATAEMQRIRGSKDFQKEDGSEGHRENLSGNTRFEMM